MPSKQSIIDNVAEYTAAELAAYIRDGIVTFDELCEEPEFSAKARKEVKAMTESSEEDDWKRATALHTPESYDAYINSHPGGKYYEQALSAKKALSDSASLAEAKEAWRNVDKNRLEDLNDFVDRYPNSSYAQQALDLVANLARSRYMASAKKRLKQDLEGEANSEVIVETIKEYMEDGAITANDLYDELAENNNWLPSTVIEQLEAERLIDFQSLEIHSGIGRPFFEYISNVRLDSPVIDVDCEPIYNIGKKMTEVYFWGIPSSGKTCALGAILSEAQHGGFVDFAEPQMCQGYHYMNMLAQTFNGSAEVFKLPEGTATDAIFEMEFVFKKDRKDYPVTFIDLAGETIDSMYRKNAGLPLIGSKQAGLDMAVNLLQGNPKINRKMHFFVLEYNGHNKTYKGLTQDTLLTGAMAYIKNTGIFRTETDAVYLLVTKSDLTKAYNNQEREQILREYLSKHYRQFYNGLKSICYENEINGGEVDIIPFSVGEVCFQNLCLFNSQDASTVVRLIMNRATGFKTGKFAKFINKLNS